MINHIFISFSTVQMYELSYIHLYSSPSTGILPTHTSGQLPVGLIVQLVEHWTVIANGFEPRSGLKSSQTLPETSNKNVSYWTTVESGSQTANPGNIACGTGGLKPKYETRYKSTEGGYEHKAWIEKKERTHALFSWSRSALVYRVWRFAVCRLLTPPVEKAAGQIGP